MAWKENAKTRRFALNMLKVSVAISGAALLFACGDDDSSFVASENGGSAAEADIVVTIFDDLPNCTGKREGKTAYIKDEKATYVCVDGDWIIGSISESVDDLLNCTSKHEDETVFVNEDKEIYVCADGEWVVAGETGKPGDPGKTGEPGDVGASCTAKSVTNKGKTRNGIELTCGETVVDTIWNGKDGEKGDDGTSCTATMNEDGFDLVCGGESVGTIKNGKNGNNGNNGDGCTLRDNGDGSVAVICGEGDNETIMNIYKAMCGTKPYDPLKSFCSEGELYSCNDKPYDPKKQYCKLGSTVEDYGWLTDTRDKQIYKTVKIGDQVWMAENLNYSVNPGEQSWCGGGRDYTEGDCSVYGRLYTWAAAIDSVALANDADNPQICGYVEECTLPTVVQGVCPEGWHLPSYDEWQTLRTAVGGEDKAGTALKSQIGWYSQTGDAADRDAYGFSALPAGLRYGDGVFYAAGDYADFWSASQVEVYSDYAYRMYLDYDFEDAHLGFNYKINAFSVRCLQN